jgi:eukaryotic-like serine/threonine-protein kinase
MGTSAEEAPPVCVGELIAGKYRVDEIIGRGGMGVVARATHLQLGTTVAVKCLLPSMAQSDVVISRFLTEARAAARITNVHVARVLDVDKLASGAPYIVMEFLEGMDLAQLLAQRGRLPPAEAAQYVIHACEALNEAHSLGVVHRDLKPANIFVTRAGSGDPCVKIVDFGISKLIDQTDPTQGSITSTQTIMGSPAYMSPEQIRSSKHVDARADIWSMGIVLYELVVGRPPFKADSANSLLAQVLTDPVPPPSAWAGDVPPQLEAIVLRCLKKKPEDRYSSMKELAAELQACAPDLPKVAATGFASSATQTFSSDEALPAPSTTGLGLSSTEVDTKRRSNRVLLAAGTLGVMVVLGLSVYWASRAAKEHEKNSPSAQASTGIPSAQPPEGSPLRIQGSSTVLESLVPSWVSSYQKEHPGSQFIVLSTGSDVGIRALLDGRADIAAASRPATANEIRRAHEKGFDLVEASSEHVIGLDGVAIIVNPSNPVSKLSLAQARNVFSGRTKDWTGVDGKSGSIDVLLRPKGHGTREAFVELLMSDVPLLRGAVTVQSPKELLGVVGSDALSISFTSFAMTGSAKVIRLGPSQDGPFIAPSQSTVNNRSYPLVRSMYLYTRGDSNPAANAFVRWVLDQGCGAIAAAGFVDVAADPVENPKRAARVISVCGKAQRQKYDADIWYDRGSSRLDGVGRAVAQSVGIRACRSKGQLEIVGQVQGDDKNDRGAATQRMKAVQEIIERECPNVRVACTAELPPRDEHEPEWDGPWTAGGRVEVWIRNP